MSTPMLELDEIIERVRRVIADARLAGRPRPGRPTIIELTELSEHQVKKALAELAKIESPADSSGSPAMEGGGVDTEEVSAVGVYEPLGVEPAGEGLETLDLQDNSAGEQAGELDIQPVLQRPRSRVATFLVLLPWPLFIIGAGAAVAVWSGWVGLGQLCGFGVIAPLPGIVDDLRVNTAVVLPLGVEAYGAYALRCWLSASGLSQRTVRFAKFSSIASLVIGAGAQVAYHLMQAMGMVHAPWPITMFVACVPVAVLGLASALAKLVTSDRQRVTSAGEEQ